MSASPVIIDYAIKMKAGMKFPPIIVWDQNDPTGDSGYLLLDGNTRKAANERNSVKFTDAYVVTDLEGREQAIYLSGIFNSINGERLSKSEIIRAVLAGKAGTNPLTDARIAQTLGVPSNRVAHIVAVNTFDARARSLGSIEVTKRMLDMPATTKVILNKTNDDAVLVDIVTLAHDASMKAADIKDLVTKTGTATSEADRRKIVADERKILQPVITQVNQGHSAIAPPARDSLMGFGRIHGLIQRFPNPADWVPFREDSRIEWHAKITEISDFLTPLLLAYENAGIIPTPVTES